MSLLNQDFLSRLPQPAPGVRWWVGLSGGLDSTVLLSRLCELAEEHSLPEIRAIHINHGLQAEADAWQAYCEALCEGLGVALHAERVSVAVSGHGLEAAAREARYRVFESCLQAGDCLLLAHHLDDQVETFFLRLMRGAGTHGLAGMPGRRDLGQGQLCRPLLDVSRSALEQWALERRLEWIEDDSNRETRLDRNFLRHELLPLLEGRWPGYRDTVSRAMVSVAESEALLHEAYSGQLGAARGSSYGAPTLDISGLPEDAAARAWLLRQWLMQLGLKAPGRDSLQEFIGQVADANAESRPRLAAADYQLRAYRQLIYALPGDGQLCEPGSRWQIGPGESLDLPGLGRVSMRRCPGGLEVPAEGTWILALRQGGERCRPRDRSHSQSLKKLLQESELPPWWRQGLPLLYRADTLVAVAGLGLCDEPRPAADSEGWMLAWQPQSLTLSD